jgi:hypothetical protein
VERSTPTFATEPSVNHRVETHSALARLGGIMTLGETKADALAYELAQTDFDAIERDGLRAAWSADGTTVTVSELDGDDELAYDAEDLVRATSDRELSHARNEPEV